MGTGLGGPSSIPAKDGFDAVAGVERVFPSKHFGITPIFSVCLALNNTPRLECYWMGASTKGSGLGRAAF